MRGKIGKKDKDEGVMNSISKKEFTYGLKRGIPIAIGYIPVSFAFGLNAVSGGIPAGLVILMSLTNLTSAGQAAGADLVIQGAGYFELILTIFVINIRYMLMSLSISQKIKKEVTLPQRLVFAFGITDEVFAVSSMENGKLSFQYMLGLITGPILGWTSGTALGALICSALPTSIKDAMGIALYGMFIAIIIPPAKKSKKVVLLLVISVLVTCILKYVPILCRITSGFRVIIATFISAGFCAMKYPLEEERGGNV